jgi:serine protease inhibitor
VSYFQEGPVNATVELASGAFLAEGYIVKPKFKKILVHDFVADVETVDFRQREAAADTINQWVAQRTHGKIRTLVSPGNLY